MPPKFRRDPAGASQQFEQVNVSICIISTIQVLEVLSALETAVV